jgi:hypothetical protein
MAYSVSALLAPARSSLGQPVRTLRAPSLMTQVAATSMTTLDVLIERLASFRRSLTETVGETHRFRRISAVQSDHAYSKFKTLQPLTNAEWVATMFSGFGHVREFQTSVFVTSCVMRQFITTIEQAHARRDLISVLGYLRSLLERIAHLHFVTKYVSDKMDKAPTSESHPFTSTFEIDMRNALYGTTVKINEIAGKQLQDIDLKRDIGKGLRQDLGLHFAKQVLDKIDMLDKDVPGTRAAYEILCDYLHPNVGDLLATTLSYTELVDRFRHQTYRKRDRSRRDQSRSSNG